MTKNDQVLVTEDGNVAQIELNGQFIGGEETSAVRNALIKQGDEGRTIVINMSGVTFVNSSFIGALLAGQTAVTRRGGKLAVVGLSESLKKLFATTQLDKLLIVHENRDDVSFDIAKDSDIF